MDMMKYALLFHVRRGLCLNSGYLVLENGESETWDLKNLPFPQDQVLTIRHDEDQDSLFLIPALNQPLSSNRYYAIVANKKDKGEAFRCWREEDKFTSCLCSYIDVEPRPLDPTNIYQQFRIQSHGKATFTATSIASDGFPPDLLGREGWTISGHYPDNFKLGEARGLDSQLRASLPELGLINSTVAVGKWYTPFVFVNEELLTLRDQVKRSMYYEVTLEQRWDKIYSCKRKDHDGGNTVVIDASFDKEQVFVGRSRATWNEKSAVNGVVWFKKYGGSVGLRVELVERMKWEEERGGWINGGGGKEEIKKVEEFQREGGWNEFGYYVMVERFNLNRMDGSFVMCYDFKHFHHFKTKWE